MIVIACHPCFSVQVSLDVRKRRLADRIGNGRRPKAALSSFIESGTASVVVLR